jgi:Cu-Zn family superoxide dismutase
MVSRISLAVTLLASMSAAQFEPHDSDFVPLPIKWKPKRAICRMHWNPSYPTTNPWGIFYLYQNGPTDDVHISGFMHSLPSPQPYKYGFAINKDRVRWQDQRCESAGTHWDPTGEDHGMMNGSPSHVGDLMPFVSGFGGSGWYYEHPERPTMYGPLRITKKKAMTIYEKPDDFGEAGTDDSLVWGSTGRPIACCNIRRYRIWTPYRQSFSSAKGRGLEGLSEEDYEEGRLLEGEDDDDYDVDATDSDDVVEDNLTPDEFRLLFGAEADPARFFVNP